MDSTTTVTTPTSSKRRQPSCACCVFLNDGLFLPDGPASAEANEEETNDDDGDNGVVMSPFDALKCLQDYAQEQQQQQILLVDTHNHAHLKQERHDTYCDGDEANDKEPSLQNSSVSVISLTLAVEPADWDDALQYSATCGSGTIDMAAASTLQLADRTLMGLGIHPWYLSEEIQNDNNNNWKDRLEALLRNHPSAIVGEIGLCKMAKCARNHPEGKTKGFEFQRQVLMDQLELATRYKRPVSIHCVQQHGVMLDMLKEIAAKSEVDDNNDNPQSASNLVPPAMAMHSFTGTAHHVKALLQWEAALFGEGPNDSKRKRKKQQQQQDTTTTTTITSTTPRRPLIYFGFSHIVNYEMCTSVKARRQGREAVCAVPLDRLLAESDVHHPQDVPAGTAGAIAYMAWALELPVPTVATMTAQNGMAFLQSHLSE